MYKYDDVECPDLRSLNKARHAVTGQSFNYKTITHEGLLLIDGVGWEEDVVAAPHEPTEAEIAQVELYSLDSKLGRDLEDVVNTLIEKGIIDGTEETMSVVMENKSKKEAARSRL